MSASEPTSSAEMMKELEELRGKLASSGEQMSKLMKRMDGNSTYRDDIIWLAREINEIQERIKKVELKIGKAEK
jgi:hypothetical protein